MQEVEFVDGEPVPVMKKVKAKGVRTTKKEVFERLYKESFNLKRNIRRKYIIDGMAGLFRDLKTAQTYVDDNLERKKRNLICRRTRLVRKVNLQNFNYFVTVIYFYGRSLYDSTGLSDLSPFVASGCSTAKSASQRQKNVAENF